MSKFALKETMLSIRDAQVRVRELTQGERTRMAEAVTVDKFRGPAMVVSLGCIDPKFTEEEAANESAEVISTISAEIMKLSGMGGDDSKNA